METKFNPGDSIIITGAGPNNSAASEYDNKKSLTSGSTVYQIKEIKRGGNYTGKNVADGYTLILTTGNPVWSWCCRLAQLSELPDPIINTYSIY